MLHYSLKRTVQHGIQNHNYESVPDKVRFFFIFKAFFYINVQKTHLNGQLYKVPVNSDFFTVNVNAVNQLFKNASSVMQITMLQYFIK